MMFTQSLRRRITAAERDLSRRKVVNFALSDTAILDWLGTFARSIHCFGNQWSITTHQSDLPIQHDRTLRNAARRAMDAMAEHDANTPIEARR